jgi:CspA family cold shock protein
MTDTKSTGIIRTLNPRMFGFITREGETKDLFFHEKDLVGIKFQELQEGDKVTFQVSQTPKGPNAVNVEKVA